LEEEMVLNQLRQAYTALQLKIGSTINFAEANADRLILIFIATYAAVFSGYTIFMHYAFKTYAWDLGVFTQSLWSTINLGKPFYYSIEAQVNPSQNFLGAHFSPVLVLVLPFYAIYQSPITLLVIQSLIIGLAALPVYWIAKNKLNSKLWGLTLALAFLLHPSLQGMNCFDFHVEAFIPLFFLLAFYYLDKRQWLKGVLFAILTLSTIEFAPILVVFLGIYFLVRETLQKPKTSLSSTLKRATIPLLLIAASLSWFFGAFYVMHSINPLKATGLPGNWDLWGSSMSEVILNVLKNPIAALGVMANPIEKVYYAFSLFVPVVFLPFLSPLGLFLVLPWLLAALLSDYSPYYQPYFQYFGFIAAQIFIAAIYGVKRLIKLPNQLHGPRLLSSMEKKLIALILVVSLISTFAISPIALPALTRRPVEVGRHVQILHELLGLIPANASVATENDILPHLAQREKVLILGWPRQSTVDSLDVDFIIVDIKSSHFLYGASLSLVPPNEALPYIIKSSKYGLMASADGVLLFKKGYTGEYIMQPYEETFNYEDFWKDPTRSYIGFDGSSRSGRIIVYDTSYLSGRVWFGPYAYIFTGEYNATFRLKTKSENFTFVVDVYYQGSPKVERTLTSNDFEGLDKWQNFTLNFRVDDLCRIEFRGQSLSNNTYMALDYVQVTQVGR
jgi:uncharacterized membrane protein